MERIFTNLLKVYCDPGNLVLVLNTSEQEQVVYSCYKLNSLSFVMKWSGQGFCSAVLIVYLCSELGTVDLRLTFSYFFTANSAIEWFCSFLFWYIYFWYIYWSLGGPLVWFRRVSLVGITSLHDGMLK